MELIVDHLTGMALSFSTEADIARYSEVLIALRILVHRFVFEFDLYSQYRLTNSAAARPASCPPTSVMTVLMAFSYGFAAVPANDG